MSWPTAKLGDVASFVRGITFKPADVVPPSTPGVVACMRTKNVQEHLDQGDVWCVDRSFVRRPDQYLREGDILISSANSWNLVGKCCWIPSLDHNATFGGFVTTLRANPEKLVARFLYHWFSTPHIQTLARSFGQKTTNISNLNLSRCLAMELPLPPLQDQRRVAAILDKAEEIRTRRETSRTLLSALPEAAFREMFGDPADNPLGIPTAKLGEISRLGTGGTPSRTSEANFGGTIPWVKTTEVNGTIITATDEYLTEAGLKSSNCRVFPRGSIVVAMYGQGKTRGRCAILGIEATTNQACAVIPPSPHFNTTFLFTQLSMSYDRLRAMARGGNQENLNLSLVSSFVVLAPPLDAQNDFARKVEAVQTVIDRRSATSYGSEELLQSLLERAFDGGL